MGFATGGGITSGVSNLDEIADVNTSGASDGEVLTYNSGTWESAAVSGAVPRNIARSTSVTNGLILNSATYQSVTFAAASISKTAVNSYFLVRLVSDGRGADAVKGLEMEKFSVSGQPSTGEIEVRVGGSLDTAVSTLELPRSSNSGDMFYINDLEWMLFDQGAISSYTIQVYFRTQNQDMRARFRSMSLVVEEIFL